MPCFFRLACSLALSHSNSIASPDLECTDNQYFVQGPHDRAVDGVAKNNRIGRAAMGRDIALWREVVGSIPGRCPRRGRDAYRALQGDDQPTN
jgi:hypothetical protein